MTGRPLDKLDDTDLVNLFIKTANELGETVNNWLGTGASGARKILDIGNTLRSHGTDSRLMLASLLDSTNRYVQYYAALELEGLIPERCRAIIEKNAAQGDAIAGDARSHLRAVDSGFYKPN
jgi:hypothetical protein